MSNNFIPNSFQTPNVLVDDIMPLLTPQEWVVLSYATRRILGWQDTIGSRQANISFTQFENTGLTRPAIKSALDGLEQYGLLKKIGKPSANGQKWELAYDANINLDGLKERAEVLSTEGAKRTENARLQRLAKTNVLSTEKAKRNGNGVSETNSTLGGMSHIPIAGMSHINNETQRETQEEVSNDTAKPPKTVQPHIAIIDAWLAALPAKPMVKDVYGRYSPAAVPMAQAGITPDDVTRYVKELRKEQFWRGKLIGLEYVAQNIGVWLEDQGKGVNFEGSIDTRDLVEHPGIPGVLVTRRDAEYYAREMEKDRLQEIEWQRKKALKEQQS